MNVEDILAKLRERVSEPDAKTAVDNLMTKVSRASAERNAINVREQFEALHAMLGTFGMGFDNSRVLEAATALVGARIIADAIHGVANEIAAVSEHE